MESCGGVAGEPLAYGNANHEDGVDVAAEDAGGDGEEWVDRLINLLLIGVTS